MNPMAGIFMIRQVKKYETTPFSSRPNRTEKENPNPHAGEQRDIFTAVVTLLMSTIHQDL